MRETFFAAIFAVASTIAIFALPGAAFAASAGDQMTLCAAAADEEGIAGPDYRVKFVKSRGGSVKKVVLKFIPADGGAAITANCRIENGEVTELAVKS